MTGSGISDLMEDLKSLLGDGCLTEDRRQRLRCGRDWWSQALWWSETEMNRHIPAAAAQPADMGEISRLLRWARDRGVAVVTRGGGSGVCGAAIPEGQDSIVLETIRLNRILSTDFLSSEPSVTIGAGVLGGELERDLNQKGWGLMHIPASLETSTVGGWIATGSHGQLSTLYGGIGEQVKHLRVVMADGSIAEPSPTQMLSSEGTLGVIAEATLRVRRLPHSHFFLSCEFPRAAQGFAFVRELASSGIFPAVARLYDPMETSVSGLKHPVGRWASGPPMALTSWLLRHRDWIRPLSLALISRRPWLLVLVLEAQQRAERDEIARRLQHQGIKTSEGPARHWVAKRFDLNTEKVERFFERGCFVDTLDAWGRWDRLEEIYAAIWDAVSPHAIAMAHASHFSRQGACLYFLLAGRGKSRKDSIQLHHRAWSAAMDACVSSGGLVNHHHGIGLAKLAWARHAHPEGWLEEWKRSKTNLDPTGILNPGKLLT